MPTPRLSPDLQMAALNPNTSARALGELAEQFPREVLRNPALSLHRLANPAFLTGWPLTGVLALVRQADAQAWVLQGAARHPDVRARGADLEGLVRSDNSLVREAVAARTDLPLAWLLALVQDDVAAVRREVAGHPRLPAEARAALAGDSYAGVRTVIAGRADLPLGQMTLLSGDVHPGVAQAIAARPDLPDTLLRRAATHAAFAVRMTAARHPFLGSDLRRRLLQDRSAGVRAAVTAARDASLHGPSSAEALLCALGNACTPEHAAHPQPILRRVAARQSTLPPSALARLARDADAAVRALVAGRADLPATVRSALCHDADLLVAREARRAERAVL